MLTQKKKKLADAWLELDNLADAYYAAGYSTNASRSTARRNAHRIINDPEVQDYIQERLAQIEDARIADVEEVLKYLTSVLRGESLSEVVVVEGRGDGYSSAKRVEKAPDERERLKAAELLGKRYGLYVDRTNLDADLDLTINVNYGED